METRLRAGKRKTETEPVLAVTKRPREADPGIGGDPNEVPASYANIKCLPEVDVAIKALPGNGESHSLPNLYLLMAHAHAAVAKGATPSIEEFIDGFKQKSDEERAAQLKAWAYRPRPAKDKKHDQIAVAASHLKNVKLSMPLAKAVQTVHQFSTCSIQKGFTFVLPAVFPPLPITTAVMELEEHKSITKIHGGLNALDLWMAKNGKDPRVLLEASQGVEKFWDLVNEIRQADLQLQLGKYVSRYRLAHFPLPIDQAFRESIESDDGFDSRIATDLSAYIYKSKQDELTALQALYKKDDATLTALVAFFGYQPEAKSKISHSLSRIMASPAVQAYMARLALKQEEQQSAISTAHLSTMQFEPAGAINDVQQASVPVWVDPVFDESGNIIGEYRRRVDPDISLIIAEKRHQPDSDHNRRWPWGDPANPGKVHPAYADADDSSRCAANVGITKVSIAGKDLDKVCKLYEDNLAEINAALLQEGSTSPAPRKLTRDQLKTKLENACRHYLEAVRQNDIPSCYDNLLPDLMKPENCDSPTEAAALAGENPQYGVLLRDYRIEMQPLMHFPVNPADRNSDIRIVGMFSGMVLASQDEQDAYAGAVGDNAAERYLHSDGIALPKKSGDYMHQMATLGYGNYMRFINTTFTQQASGILRSDEERCNMLLVPVRVTLKDKNGQEREEYAPVGLQYRPVREGRQLKTYYGSSYKLDTSPAEEEVQVKQEPED